MDRDETITRIRTALKQRSGKTWSVTGGRGTAYGWVKIDAPPARQTAIWQLKAGMEPVPGNYEEIDTGKPGGHMTPADRDLLKELLSLDTMHHQGVSIPASGAYHQEYIDRAEGRTPSKLGEPYWD